MAIEFTFNQPDYGFSLPGAYAWWTGGAVSVVDGRITATFLVYASKAAMLEGKQAITQKTVPIEGKDFQAVFEKYAARLAGDIYDAARRIDPDFKAGKLIPPETDG